jgi:hypothetical protein
VLRPALQIAALSVGYRALRFSVVWAFGSASWMNAVRHFRSRSCEVFCLQCTVYHADFAAVNRPRADFAVRCRWPKTLVSLWEYRGPRPAVHYTRKLTS